MNEAGSPLTTVLVVDVPPTMPVAYATPSNRAAPRKPATMVARNLFILRCLSCLCPSDRTELTDSSGTMRPDRFGGSGLLSLLVVPLQSGNLLRAIWVGTVTLEEGRRRVPEKVTRAHTIGFMVPPALASHGPGGRHGPCAGRRPLRRADRWHVQRTSNALRVVGRAVGRAGAQRPRSVRRGAAG